MKAEEIIENISLIENAIRDYVINTEHWIFYWITNTEVQDFIKEYPDDYEDRIDLCVNTVNGSSISFSITFKDHPYAYGVVKITRFGILPTFRETVKAKWMEWNGKIKEMKIEEKKEELAYHKRKVEEIEKELNELTL